MAALCGIQLKGFGPGDDERTAFGRLVAEMYETVALPDLAEIGELKPRTGQAKRKGQPLDLVCQPS